SVSRMVSIREAIKVELRTANEVMECKLRRSPMFEFARFLRISSEFKHCSAAEALDLIQTELGTDWWSELRGFSNKYEDVPANLVTAWNRVVFPGLVDHAVSLAASNPYPATVVGMSSKTASRFVSILWHLQRLSGTAPIIVPIDKFARILGVAKMTVSTYRTLLVQQRFLQVVSKGCQSTKRAGKYFFVSSLLEILPTEETVER